MQTEQQQSDLLVFEKMLIRARAEKRFLNYIIDMLGFIIFLGGIMFIVSIFTSGFEEFLENDRLGISISILYALYMSSLELLSKGKSLGKVITRTRAVNLDGSNISAKAAFGRGFIRIVPFCALSAFGSQCNPWQDRWTNTMVIDEKKSE